ncbi:trypsin-like serine protease [Chelatococcus sp. SYSU_G07232]|uniref:Trypsin-like serine protease n=1 Tax=Chelatococcus albus TaxID=3047466 RepID=A0ABT7AI20_9HYPH|nr:trypsin-like serine protease [Chelatococcus sp. SYSU_G07232]MDJ1159032.1 trypsin-like serine protease [Chelatococcus sp. SYSU_G07232]
MVRSLRVAATALVTLAAVPAGAVVGGREGGAWERSAVMVLGSRGNVCSGVVLAADVVLTAAHCVKNAPEHRIHFRSAAGEPVLVTTAGIAVHPGYRAEAVARRERSVDIALVRLAEPLPDSFAPARLSAAAPPAAGTRLALGGYGVAREDEPRSSGTFRTADLAAVEPYGRGAILVWLADPAGLGKRPGAGACEGDSGGPIADGGSIVAVTSWSTGAGKATCGLLTQGIALGPQRAWIDATLARWGRMAQWGE